MIPSFAVIGHPVEHSLSPKMHQLFAESTGVQLNYQKILAPLNGFKSTVLSLIEQGFQGVNVTRPFKEEALQFAQHVSARAELAGAANTLTFDLHDQGIACEADNTDGIGLVRDILNNAQMPIKAKSILLIGAGGAAAGVLAPLLEEEPKTLVIANRTLSKSEQLVLSHQKIADQCHVELCALGFEDCGTGFDIVINASGSSQDGRPIPVADTVLKKGSLALDMTYGKAADPFIHWAQTQGAVGRDGLGMLVEQGAESFFIWHGVKPDTGMVLKQLREVT